MKFFADFRFVPIDRVWSIKVLRDLSRNPNNPAEGTGLGLADAKNIIDRACSKGEDTLNLVLTGDQIAQFWAAKNAKMIPAKMLVKNIRPVPAINILDFTHHA